MSGKKGNSLVCMSRNKNQKNIKKWSGRDLNPGSATLKEELLRRIPGFKFRPLHYHQQQVLSTGQIQGIFVCKPTTKHCSVGFEIWQEVFLCIRAHGH